MTLISESVLHLAPFLKAQYFYFPHFFFLIIGVDHGLSLTASVCRPGFL